MFLLMYGIQFSLLIPFVIAFFAITLALSFIKRRNDDSEDDCGYLEIVVSEKGGLEDEEVF